MADPVLGMFQTTLLVLYFVSPAQNVKAPFVKKDLESSKVWSLQATSQIPTENPNMCAAMGIKLIHEFDDVSTVTVRAYCMCPEKVIKNDICYNRIEAERKLLSLAPGAKTGTIIRLGPDTVVPLIQK